MFYSRVESLAHPGIKRFAALLGGALPLSLLGWQCAKGAGAQGDATEFWVSPCSLPRATVVRHLIHVSGVYLKFLISTIRFHLDRLDFVL
jgi:hypothetical protein